MNKRQKPTDGLLILQYRAGNTSVLASLVKRYHKLFCQKAYWITKDKELAKDIAQNSWITIINKLHKLEHVDSFRSWALRIVYTKSIDEVKHRNKESKNLASVEALVAGTQNYDDQSKFIEIALLKAIKELPKEKQDIIRLFYAEAYTINKISAFLNIPVGTVKSRLFKAREKLKSIIKEINHDK